MAELRDRFDGVSRGLKSTYRSITQSGGSDVFRFFNPETEIAKFSKTTVQGSVPLIAGRGTIRIPITSPLITDSFNIGFDFANQAVNLSNSRGGRMSNDLRFRGSELTYAGDRVAAAFGTTAVTADAAGDVIMSNYAAAREVATYNCFVLRPDQFIERILVYIDGVNVLTMPNPESSLDFKNWKLMCDLLYGSDICPVPLDWTDFGYDENRDLYRFMNKAMYSSHKHNPMRTRGRIDPVDPAAAVLVEKAANARQWEHENVHFWEGIWLNLVFQITIW